MFRLAWPLHSRQLRPEGFRDRHPKNPLLQRRLKDGELLTKGPPGKQPRRGELISMTPGLPRALKLLQCSRYAGHAAAHSIQQHLTLSTSGVCVLLAVSIRYMYNSNRSKGTPGARLCSLLCTLPPVAVAHTHHHAREPPGVTTTADKPPGVTTRQPGLPDLHSSAARRHAREPSHTRDDALASAAASSAH